jgi:hypothetical protein
MPRERARAKDADDTIESLEALVEFFIAAARRASTSTATRASAR